MGTRKITLREGNGPRPGSGDMVTMEYTGWVKDASKDEQKGKQFDTSTGRGPFQTQIGVGRVIQGWDYCVMQMRVGEKARLEIDSDNAYGSK
jgi:FK506-binding protein 1